MSDFVKAIIIVLIIKNIVMPIIKGASKIEEQNKSNAYRLKKRKESKASQFSDRYIDSDYVTSKPTTQTDIFNKKESETLYSKPSNNLNLISCKVLFILYVFYEIDNELSRKEKRFVQNYITKETTRLSSKEKTMIQSLITVRPNLDYLFDKIDEYQLEYNTVFDLTNEVRSTLKTNNDSERILKRIEDRVTYEL